MKSVSLKNLQSTFGFKPNPQTCAGELANDTPIKFVVQDNEVKEGQLPEPDGTTIHIVSVVVFNALKSTRSDIAMWDPAGKDSESVYHTVILADGSVAAITE